MKLFALLLLMAVAPVTLTWTNPTRLTARDPFRPAGDHRIPCDPSTLAADTLLDLHHVEVWVEQRREREDGSICDPPDTSCWNRRPPYILASVPAVGREGKRETVSVTPPLGVSVVWVVAVDDDGNRSCASAGVTVER